MVFKTVIQTIESQNPEWYRRLATNLSQEDVKAIQEVFKLGEQRVAARRSKSIEQAGGTLRFQLGLKQPSLASILHSLDLNFALS